MADLNQVQQAVVSAGASGVRNLVARQNGNTIEIHGTAESIAAKQSAFKTISDRVGDTAGIMNLIQVAQETPQAQPPQAMPQSMASASGMAPQPAAQPAQQRTHTVAKNENLGAIAQHYYGKASEYKKIFEANRDKLSDPDKVREGMTLVIPA